VTNTARERCEDEHQQRLEDFLNRFDVRQR
jgi:hypothetical protein